MHLNISIRKKRKCSFLLHGWFPVKFVFTYNISLSGVMSGLASETSNTKYLELIKRRLKVQEKDMSCERALKFDQ